MCVIMYNILREKSAYHTLSALLIICPNIATVSALAVIFQRNDLHVVFSLNQWCNYVGQTGVPVELTNYRDL